MTNRFEMPPQNHSPIQEVQGVEPKVVEQIKEDLRDLFRSAENPVAILLQTMETNEFKGVVSDEIANPVKAQLQGLTFENEDDFVAKIIAVAMPVLEITKRGKKDAYKQEGREMFTEADVEATIAIVKESGAEKIYVVGNVGSGKTTFARELSRATNYRNIDIDQWFQIFRQEQQREAADLKELLGYILQKEKPPFIINHADLLRQDLVQDADMIVFLNPKKEEQLKSRQLRTESGAEGEWQAVSADDYEKIAEENQARLESLGGKTKYSNEKSGTIVRVLKSE
jgi:adenylate kinase family enzyme